MLGLLHAESPDEDGGSGNDAETKRDTPDGAEVVLPEATSCGCVRSMSVSCSERACSHPIENQRNESRDDETEINHRVCECKVCTSSFETM